MMDENKFIAHYREFDGEKQALKQHLFGVAEKSRLAAGKIGLENQGELIGLLHDLGKYSQKFQNYLKSAVGLLNQDEDEEYVDAKGLKGKIDHSSAGAQLLWQELSKHGEHGQIAGQILTLCMASHHSGLVDCLDVTGKNIFQRRMNKPDCKTHLQEALRNIDSTILTVLENLLARPELVKSIISSIKAIAEKDVQQGEVIIHQKVGLLTRMLFSCLIDADRIDTADFECPKAGHHRLNGIYESWPVLVDRLEEHLRTLEPRSPIDPLRQDISRHCLDGASRDKGIFTLSVPTGGGKTLASLRFALHHAYKHNMDRIIYVVPFTSIIDQNAQEVRKILEPKAVERGSIVLEHHSNLVPEVQSWREKILTENWDAPVIYTTMVQLLETLFAGGTRGARRMHQLANTILIFDEVQSLPVNCIHLFNNAMNYLVEQCKSSVVLCTATQPLLHKVCPKKGAIGIGEDSELMPDVKQMFDDLKRVEVKNRQKAGGWEQADIVKLAIAEMTTAGSCLVIVNTKKAAQAIYQECRKYVGAYTFHLSTNMCPVHRKKVLKAIKCRTDKSKSILCVSTQLIEAGVDVDFGSVIRFTAGLDSIAQAAGRCNRHGKRAMGTVHVVNPKDENLGMLSDIKIGREKAERVLNDYQANPERFDNSLLSPKAMAWYYENYFFKRKDDMVYPVSANAIGRDDNLLNMLSCNTFAVSDFKKRHNKAPKMYLRQSFMTASKAFKAINAPTQGIIVPYGKKGKDLILDLCVSFDAEKEYKLLKQAQQFTVNVFSSDLNKLQAARAVFPIQEGVDIFYLDARFYSKTIGLSTTPTGDMEVHIG